MFAVAPLQTSWLTPVSSSEIVSPLHAPTPDPEGTVVEPMAPPIEKLLVAQPAGLTELTVAVTEEIVTGEEFGLSKFPLRPAAAPPG